MTLWDHVCSVWDGLHARASAFWHLLRGHKLHWRDNVDLWVGCTGEIWCETCPDTTDGRSDLTIWIRYWQWLNRVGEWVCGWLWHRHPQWWNGKGDPSDDGNMVDVADEWYCCYRCGATVRTEDPA